MVFVVDKNRSRLMPTNEYRARRLMKKRRAVIHKRCPFTIQLTDRKGGDTQPLEYTSGTGYLPTAGSAGTIRRIRRTCISTAPGK